MKILTYFFTTLGVIFFVLLCGLAYVWFADPFNIRPFIEMMTTKEEVSSTATPTSEDASSSADSSSGTTEQTRKITPEQEEVLSSVGIDIDALPELTPEMEACFTAELGEARVAEIKAGASPTPTEIFSTRTCYQ